MPQVLRRPTPGAPLPAEPTVGAWVVFGDAQTGQLDKANVNGAASMAIVEACEARDRAADKKITKRPWWAIL